MVSAMNRLLEASRNFDPMTHPAIQNMMREREQEAIDSLGEGELHDEL